MTDTAVDVAINLSALVGAVCFAFYQRDFVLQFSVRQLLLLTTAASFLLLLSPNAVRPKPAPNCPCPRPATPGWVAAAVMGPGPARDGD